MASAYDVYIPSEHRRILHNMYTVEIQCSSARSWLQDLASTRLQNWTIFKQQAKIHKTKQNKTEPPR